MSQLVRKHWCYFQLLASTSSVHQRKHLLDTITNDQLRALQQLVNNFLQRVLPVTPSDLKALKSHKRLIRQIGDKSITFKKKKILLCRRGKVIATFVKSIEPALKSYLR